MNLTPESQKIPGARFLPPVIPDYELLRRIGSGSYGEVWLARSAAGIYRAVKVVYRSTFEHNRPFERELSGIQKFEPVSRTHASQVNILAVGRNEPADYFYYVMELADSAVDEHGNAAGPGGFPPGQIEPESYTPKTLKSELAAHGRLPFQQCLEIGLSLTKALDHLHLHGLIHRDIKPSNVIFVQGIPKLADIGLVTDVGATVSYVGTEGFLPPEGPGTPQADIYSLGKVLYEISTGRDRLDFPELPTFIGTTAADQGLFELNLVFLKACQTEPRKRYQSAKEMYADLALLQSGKSLRRARALEQKLANLTKLGLAGGAAVLVAVGSYYFINQHRLKKLHDEKLIAQREKLIAEGVATKTKSDLATLATVDGEAREIQGDLFGALLRFTQAFASDPNPNQETHLRRINAVIERCPNVLAIMAGTGRVSCAAFSPDGLRVVVAGDSQAGQVWEVATGQPLGPLLKHGSPIYCAEFNPDGQSIVTARGDGTAQIWNALTGEATTPGLKHGRRIVEVAFSPDGRELLTVADDPTALIWQVSGGRPRLKLNHTDRVVDAAFSRDGKYVGTASADHTAQVWSAATGEPISGPLAHPEPVNHLSFCPDSRRLATASGTQGRVWSAASGARAEFILSHDALINSVSFSPDGRRLITASDDQTVRVWDPLTGKLLLGPLRHPKPVQRAVFSPDARRILTVSGNEVRQWNPRTGEVLPPVFIMNDQVVQAQFSADDDRLVIAAADGSVRITETIARPLTNSALAQLKSHPLEYWVALAELLSGRQIDGQRVVGITPEKLHQAWQIFRKANAEELQPIDLLVWHRQVAERCEAERQWFGANFHWDRLLAKNPNDPSIRQRKDQAAAEMANVEIQSVHSPQTAEHIPARAAETRPALIDLTAFYNAALTETWFPTNVIASGNDLSNLSRGVQKLGGVEFDVRGLVQLSGSALEDLGGQFPRQVKGIKINQRCQRLHFLHGAGWDALFGTVIGRYQINYANGETREIKLVFGQNIRDWWFFPTQHQPTSGATLAWQGSNRASQGLGMGVRLYQMTWTNPLPELEILSIDFISTVEKSAPFLVAITAE